MTTREIADTIVNCPDRIQVYRVGDPERVRHRVRMALYRRGYWADKISLATVDEDLVAVKRI